eukprot:m.421941 g.421941  ORF g.421941 m.421941 type:complete len:520 (+) comp21322_c0_seq1:268-1827(+)
MNVEGNVDDDSPMPEVQGNKESHSHNLFDDRASEDCAMTLEASGVQGIPSEGQALLRAFPVWPDGQRAQFLQELVSSMTCDDHVCVSNLISPLLRRDMMELLPEEICWNIFYYLDLKSLRVASQVNRTWNRVLSSEYFWRKLLQLRRNTDADWAFMADQRQRFLNVEAAGFSWKRVFCLFNRDLNRIARNWNVPHSAVVYHIRCNGSGIYCLQYDDSKVVTGSRDNTIKFWDFSSLKKTKEFRGHQGSVLCLQFDNEKVISGSSDATVRVWDIKTGECMQILDEHCMSVLHLKFHGSLLVTCSKDRMVILWEWNAPSKKYRSKFVLDDHEAAVNVVEFDENFIVSASGDRTIRVWHTATGEVHRVLKGHVRGIACLQFQGDIVVSGSSDKTLRKWSIAQGKTIAKLVGHNELVRCVRFNSTHIVSGSYDQTVRVWDFETGKQLMVLRGHQNRVFRVQFDRFKIVSSSQDDQVLIWDFFSGPRVVPSPRQGVPDVNAGIRNLLLDEHHLPLPWQRPPSFT